MLESKQNHLYYPRMTKNTRTPSPLASLFKARRKAQKLSQVALADRVRQLLGPDETFSQQTYAAFEAGSTQNTRFALQIAQALDVSMDEVATLSSAPTQPISEAPSTPEETALSANETPGTGLHAPIFSDNISATVKDPKPKYPVPFSKLSFDTAVLADMDITPKDVACMIVQGNSMAPVLPDGSTVGIDQGRHRINDGDIYAIRHGGLLRVKILYKLPLGGIRMRSFNREEYPDEEYSPERLSNEKISIVGRIFWYSVFR